MSHLRSLVRLAPLGLLCVACAGAHMTSYTPVNEKTKFKQEVLFAAARDAVVKLGGKIHMADVAAHTVDTPEREVAISSIPRLSYKYSFHIETTDGVLAIEAKCVQNSAAKESEYKDCGEDRPALVMDEMEAIRKKTLELAPNETDTSYDWSNYGKEPPPPPEKADEKKADTDSTGKTGKTGKAGKARTPAKPKPAAPKTAEAGK